MEIVDGALHLEEARALMRAYTARLGRDLGLQGIEDELADPARKYAPPTGELLLALDEGRAVGMVAYHRLTEGRCEMKRLFVDPAYRGHHAGERLARAIIRHARAAGYGEMVLDTIRPLTAAISLYTKLGFCTCAPYYDNPMDDVLYFRLDLTTPTVRPAAAHELDAVWALYGAVADEMRDTPHDVWWRLGMHPTRKGLEQACRDGNLFVAEESGVDEGTPLAGAFVLDGSQGPDYARIPWRVACGADEVAVVHLLAVAPAARGRQVGRRLVEAAAEEARRRGARALRLDVFDNNAPAIALYRAAGFADCGVFDITVGAGLTHPSHLMELDLATGA